MLIHNIVLDILSVHKQLIFYCECAGRDLLYVSSLLAITESHDNHRVS